MTLYGIYYTDLCGKRRRYMGTGFETRPLAEAELARIMMDRGKRDIADYDPDKCPSYLTGKNWEIKPIQFTKA